MNPSEIPQLLAEIALADPRVRRDDPTERRGQIKMWAGILTDIPYGDALRLAQKHYANSQWPIVPSDIAASWRAIIRDRLERHTDPTPEADPDTPGRWNAELRATRQAVIAGELAPAPYTEAEGDRRPIAALTARIGRPLNYVPDEAQRLIGRALPARARREAQQAARQTSGTPDPLVIPCPWCSARAGDMCRHMGSKTKLTPRTTVHPARGEAAAAHREPA